MNAKKILFAVLTVLTVAYPPLVYYGLQHIAPLKILGAIVCLLTLRLIFADNKNRFAGIVALIFVASIGLLVTPEDGLKAYPVIINGIMFCIFFGSLYQKKNIIETFAEKMHPDLPPEGRRHTRCACIAWCLFFLFNGSIAMVTVFLSAEIWAIYNGCISYLLMACLFAGEYIVRRQVQQKAKMQS